MRKRSGNRGSKVVEIEKLVGQQWEEITGGMCGEEKKGKWEEIGEVRVND